MAVIDCICPPTRAGETRHPDGDTVTLRERLDFRAALTARNTIALVQAEEPDAGTAEVLAALTESYLMLGITDWTVVDDKGKPVPPSRTNIRELLLSQPEQAMVVADEADDLYREAVIAPLAARAARSSPPTPTTSSTSARTGSPTKRPRPSRPSSTTTSPTAAITPISSRRAGGSNSSLNSASGA